MKRHVAVASLLAACAPDAGGRPAAEPPARVAPSQRAALTAPAETPGLAPGEIAVPFGRAPAVDGEVRDDEWAGSASFSLGGGATLRLMHDGERVYLGIAGVPTSGFGFGCALLGGQGGEVHVLHASAKLGSALYTPSGEGSWRPRSKDYNWKSPEALVRDEGWFANTVRSGVGRQQEFAIGFDRLGLPNSPKPFALGYLYQRDEDKERMGVLVWPPGAGGAGDAAGDVKLLSGFNPDGLRFETARWAKLRPR